MPDIFRFGLPLAVLIALGVTCLLIALTPTVPNHTEAVHVQTNQTSTVPYTAPQEAVTSDA